jgi:hypothetical protein
VQLRNNIDGQNLLDETIVKYYKINGTRDVIIFLHSENQEWGTIYAHYLLDRTHVIRYGIGEDRGSFLGGLELAIGPHYFTPSAFWSYEASDRFTLEASTEGVIKNLRLLDEFLGYPVKPLFTS